MLGSLVAQGSAEPTCGSRVERRSGSGEDVGLGVPLIEACPEPRRRVVRGRLVDVGLLAFIDPRRPGAAELTLCLATRGCAEGQPRRKSQVFQNLPRDGAFLDLSDDPTRAVQGFWTVRITTLKLPRPSEVGGTRDRPRYEF